MRSLVNLRIERGLPRLIVHEKYEKSVKWTLRTLAAIGIVASVIAFPVWYLGLSFAVLMFLIQQFFERAIFQYTSIYVQPLPDFTYNPDEWKGMAFAFPAKPEDTDLNVVGCAFASLEYAQKFFSLVQAWNSNEAEDRDNNICLSFIVENEKEYSIYLYPNPDRKIVTKFFDQAEEQFKYEKYGKRHQKLIMHMVVCKTFPFRSADWPAPARRRI